MFNRITFSTAAEKDLVPAWKDYVNHYRKENFSTKKTVQGTKSLEEKEDLVNKMAFAEIAKFANVDTSLSENLRCPQILCIVGHSSP